MKELFNMASELCKVESWDMRILKQHISYLVYVSIVLATHPARRLLSWSQMNIVDTTSRNITYRSVGRSKMKWNTALKLFCDHVLEVPMEECINESANQRPDKSELCRNFLEFMQELKKLRARSRAESLTRTVPCPCSWHFH